MAGEPSSAKATCPASREAVEEQEERGEVGCPLCGRSASKHPFEPIVYAQPNGCICIGCTLHRGDCHRVAPAGMDLCEPCWGLS